MFLLFILTQSRGFNICYYNQNKLNRIAFSNKVKCSKIDFIEVSSESSGGAIFIDQNKTSIEVDSCLFLKCSSFGYSYIAQDASGGAIYCRISTSDISSCFFDECYGKYYGMAAYLASDQTKLLKLEDCSAVKMSGLQEGIMDSYTYTTDYTPSTIKRVNFSNPLTPSFSIFFGQWSPKISINHVAIIGKNTQRGFELSSYNTQTDINSILFLNMVAREALFRLWDSEYTVSDIHVINCSEKLAINKNRGILNVRKSWLGKGIIIDKDIVKTDAETYLEDSPIKITPVIKFNIYKICSHGQSWSNFFPILISCALIDSDLFFSKH